jgi:hypothetical protein
MPRAAREAGVPADAHVLDGRRHGREPDRTRVPPRRVAAEDKGLRRETGRLGLLSAGIGSIIGSGWLFGR